MTGPDAAPSACATLKTKQWVGYKDRQGRRMDAIIRRVGPALEMFPLRSHSQEWAVCRMGRGMRQLEVENQLRDVVSRIIVQVELATSQGRTDINLALEDAFIPILKSVYNLPHLTNLNRKQKNFPGIDLGDDPREGEVHRPAVHGPGLLQHVRRALHPHAREEAVVLQPSVGERDFDRPV